MTLQDLQISSEEFCKYLKKLLGDFQEIPKDKEQDSLGKVKSKICWLYLMSNPEVQEALSKIKNPKCDPERRDQLISILEMKYGITDPNYINGLEFNGLIKKPKSAMKVHRDFLQNRNTLKQLRGLMKQRNSIAQENVVFIMLNLNYSSKDLTEAIKKILNSTRNYRNKSSAIGSKALNRESLLLQLVSFYVSGAKSKNTFLKEIFHKDWEKEANFYTKHKGNFIKVANNAPHIFL